MANNVLLCLACLGLYLIKVIAVPCGGHLDNSALVAILSETYPRCRDLNLSLGSLVCELGDDDISSTQYGSTYIPAGVSACPDGSLDKVCYPERHPAWRAFTCVCRSAVDMSTNIPSTYWTDWATLNTPINEMPYFRSFMMDQGGCVIQEFSQVEIQTPTTATAEEGSGE